MPTTTSELVFMPNDVLMVCFAPIIQLPSLFILQPQHKQDENGAAAAILSSLVDVDGAVLLQRISIKI